MSSLGTTGALLCLFIATSAVHAGSRAWESSMKYARAPEVEVRDLSDTTSYGNGKSNGSNTNTPRNHQHNKRWLGIDETEFHTLWDKGHIKVCFERTSHTHKGQDKTTEEILRADLENARNLWRGAGLDSKDGWFGFDIQDDDDYCTSRDKRYEFLLVKYAGEGVEKMATSPGKPLKLSPDNDQHPFDKLGARMQLSDSTNMGMMNVVPNYAHEMGHAWGLEHEHQNPSWWEEKYSEKKQDSYFFGTDSWFCDKLSDYQDAVNSINNDPRYDNSPADRQKYIKEICTKRDVAVAFQFSSGMNWLPILHGVQWDNSRKKPDWGSIMIYPSTAGGIGTGSNKEKVMLKKPNGEPIEPVSKPSQLDVDGLYKMYNAKRSKAKQLLQKKGSQSFAKFKEVFKKGNRSGCV